MKIKFEASIEELAELAKMAYIAQFVFDSSGQFSEGYFYPHMKTFDAALRIFNKILAENIPGSGLVEIDERSPNVFIHTIKMEEECSGVIREFEEGREYYMERICSALAKRDYIEKGYGGDQGFERSDRFTEAYCIIYKNYMQELKAYGLKRLRIEEKS